MRLSQITGRSVYARRAWDAAADKGLWLMGAADQHKDLWLAACFTGGTYRLTDADVAATDWQEFETDLSVDEAVLIQLGRGLLLGSVKHIAFQIEGVRGWLVRQGYDKYEKVET